MGDPVNCLDKTKIISHNENDCYFNNPPSSNTRSKKNKQQTRELSSYTERFKCPICLDSFLDENPFAAICGHIFCEKCIRFSVKATHECPLCKRRLRINQLLRLYM